MATREENVRLFRELVSRGVYLDAFEATVGKAISPTQTILFDEKAGIDKVYVTPTDKRPAESVYGRHKVTQVGDTVWVVRNASGNYEIDSVVDEVSDAVRGNGGHSQVAPRPNPTADTTPVSGRRIEPGRVRIADAGGLTVWIEPFFHPGGYWAGGNLTLTVPSTASKKAWVAVYIDVLTNTAAQKLGAEQALAMDMRAVPPSDILLPMTAAPCAALVLQNGQTALTALVDLHRYTGSGTPVLDLGYWRTGTLYSFPSVPTTTVIPYHVPTNHQTVVYGEMTLTAELVVQGELIIHDWSAA